MPPRRKIGRAAAEAAYANLLKENTTLVGDVGEAFDALTAKLEEAAEARDRYEEARAAAVKGVHCWPDSEWYRAAVGVVKVRLAEACRWRLPG